MDITEVMRVSDWATMNQVDPKKAQRFARQGKLSGSFQTKISGKTWLIQKAAPVPLGLSAPSGSRRADGRQKFVVFLNADEREWIEQSLPTDAFSDPRAIRAARKAAKEAKTEHIVRLG